MLHEYLQFSAYAKVTDKGCNVWYGSYSSLLAAQSACTLDSLCEGVYDEGCTDSGHFGLCLSVKSSSSSGECVYIKGNTL